MVLIQFDKPVVHLKDRHKPKSTYLKDHFYMDETLKKNLDEIKKAVTNDWDFVLVIDGIERAGKSVFAQQLAYYLDPTLNIDRIVFSPEEFRKVCLKANKYEVIIYDEAITGGNIRQAMDKINIAINSMLGQIGQKNLFIIVVLPTFYDLDRYIALFRSRVLFHIYAKSFTDRGYLNVYKNNKNKIWSYFRKTFYYPENMKDFRCQFTDTYAVSEVEYREKKALSLTKIDEKGEEENPQRVKFTNQRNDLIYKMYKDKLYKVPEIAKYLKIDKRTIYSILDEVKERRGEVK